MYNELENANLYFEIISSICGERKLDKNKNLIIAIASIDSLDKFSNLKTKNKALVKLAMDNEGLEKFDNFADTVIKQAKFLNVIKDVGVTGTLSTNVFEKTRENVEKGLTSPTDQLSGTGTDFLKGFLSYIPIVGGGIAVYEIIKEIRKENPSYFKIAISSLIITADAFLLYSLVTRDKKGLPIGIGGKALVGILTKIRKGLEITKVEQVALNKLGPGIIKVIDQMKPNIGKIIDKLPISQAKKVEMKTELPKEFEILKQKINARTTAGNLAQNQILDTMNQVYGSISKGTGKIYTTKTEKFIHLNGDTFLTPVAWNPNGTAKEFNLIKLENVSGQGVREVVGSSTTATNRIVAQSDAAIDMMTNPNWKNPGLNIDASLLSPAMKKLYISPVPAGKGAGTGVGKAVGADGAGIGIGVAGGVIAGQAGYSIAGEVVRGITPGGTGNLDWSGDAPGAY